MITEARNTSFAVYKGKEYQAEKDYERDRIFLLSRNPQDTKNGFVEVAKLAYEKEVTTSELDTAYFVYTFAQYKGFKFQISLIEEGKALLVHTSSDTPIKHLGFKWVEPHVFEKWVPVEELESVFEENRPIWGF
jgi:hypothetical protein